MQRERPAGRQTVTRGSPQQKPKRRNELLLRPFSTGWGKVSAGAHSGGESVGRRPQCMLACLSVRQTLVLPPPLTIADVTKTDGVETKRRAARGDTRKKVFKAKDQALQGSPPLKDGIQRHTSGPKRSLTHHSISGQKKGSP